MARAKRTDRTEARRRYRAEQVALTEDAVDAEGAPVASGDKASRSKAAVQTAPAAARPSIVAAFRGSFREVQLKDDLRSLPRILTHWGFLASLGAAVAATAVFILSTNDLASSLDLSLSQPAADKTLGGVSNISYIAVSLFVAPPPAAGAFLVGFTAPRAAWLGGLIYGLVAAACYSVILLSPTGRLFVGANDPQPYIANAWVVGPIGAMFFAAASAWYKRFLNLANPNRGKKPEKAAPKGRGNAKPNSRAASRP